MPTALPPFHSTTRRNSASQYPTCRNSAPWALCSHLSPSYQTASSFCRPSQFLCRLPPRLPPRHRMYLSMPAQCAPAWAHPLAVISTRCHLLRQLCSASHSFNTPTQSLRTYVSTLHPPPPPPTPSPPPHPHIHPPPPPPHHTPHPHTTPHHTTPHHTTPHHTTPHHTTPHHTTPHHTTPHHTTPHHTTPHHTTPHHTTPHHTTPHHTTPHHTTPHHTTPHHTIPPHHHHHHHTHTHIHTLRFAYLNRRVKQLFHNAFHSHACVFLARPTLVLCQAFVLSPDNRACPARRLCPFRPARLPARLPASLRPPLCAGMRPAPKSKQP